jgi:hypothetical protein
MYKVTCSFMNRYLVWNWSQSIDTNALNGPTAPASDDRRFGMITRNEKQQCSEKYLLQWHMSTTDPT